MQNEDKNGNKNGVSKRALVVAGFKKFEFLEKHFRKAEIEKFSIRLVTEDLLANTSGYVEAEGYDDEYLENAVMFFSEKGVLLGRLGSTETEVTHRLFGVFFPRKERVTVLFEETVGEALKRLGIGNVRYIVGVTGNEPEHLIIGIPTDGMTIKETLERENAEANRVLDDMIAKANKAPAPPAKALIT